MTYLQPESRDKMGYSFYELLWFFAIYSFWGWCGEVIYKAASTGKFVNRGFLNGPICPIYGFGVVIVVVCLTPVKDNLIILFTTSIILTSTLEFITGYALEKVFNEKWWDYLQEPFNIKGYVCLKASLIWGVGCVLVMYVLHPLVMYFIIKLPEHLGIISLIIFFVLLAIDLNFTVSTLLKFKQRIHILSEIEVKITQVSETIGENLSDKVLATIKAKENHMQELEELRAKYKKLKRETHFVYNRITHAFPKLNSLKSKEFLEKIKHFRTK
ncbi:MAG: hypothetical protein K0R15_1662 [Clostridiales bacterium]|jgi:uncharacterized membrane protein|nr:hypothetical protein [Clostridiales bacterium]